MEKKKMRQIFSLLAVFFMFGCTTAKADWTSRSDELKLEIVQELTPMTKNGNPMNARVVEDFSECTAINLTAKMDLYKCKGLESKGLVSEQFNSCQETNPKLKREAGLLMMKCMSSAIINAQN